MKAGQRLIELGGEIGELSSQAVIIKRQVSKALKDLDQAKYTATPDEGWPGKNEGERSIAREKAFRENESVVKAQKTLDDLEDLLVGVDSSLERLEAERRAVEFFVRNRLASVLLGYDDEMDVAQNANTDSLAQAVGDEESLDQAQAVPETKGPALKEEKKGKVEAPTVDESDYPF